MADTFNLTEAITILLRVTQGISNPYDYTVRETEEVEQHVITEDTVERAYVVHSRKTNLYRSIDGWEHDIQNAVTLPKEEAIDRVVLLHQNKREADANYNGLYYTIIPVTREFKIVRKVKE